MPLVRQERYWDLVGQIQIHLEDLEAAEVFLINLLCHRLVSAEAEVLAGIRRMQGIHSIRDRLGRLAMEADLDLEVKIKAILEGADYSGYLKISKATIFNYNKVSCRHRTVQTLYFKWVGHHLLAVILLNLLSLLSQHLSPKKAKMKRILPFSPVSDLPR